MTIKKDYSLLRPFDLEAAKRGEAIDDTFGGRVVLVDGPDVGGRYSVRVDGHFAVVLGSSLRMAPLCWVEGKPVYKGDTLYYKDGEKVVVQKSSGSEKIVILSDEFGYCSEHADDLTWTQAKVKREGWISVISTKQPSPFSAFASNVYASKEKVESTDPNRTIIRIEWEEPA